MMSPLLTKHYFYISFYVHSLSIILYFITPETDVIYIQT